MTLEITKAALKNLLEKAYAEGFSVSGEGHNAEYSGENNPDYENNQRWLDQRARDIIKILSEAGVQ